MPARKTPSTKAQKPAQGITIRMYNSYFGDSFLLGFPRDDGGTFFALIDCGIHQMDERRSPRTKLIAADIAEVTGKHLDVVAVTHEHADHTDGFGFANAIFGDPAFHIGEFWLAWTENPEDEATRELKETYRMKIAALQLAIDRLTAAGHPLAGPLQRYSSLDLEGQFGLQGNVNIINALKGWSRKKLERDADYLSPGERPRELPGVSGVRLYVLGPPRDPAMIGLLTDKNEKYGMAAWTEEIAFIQSLLAAEKTYPRLADLPAEDYPFDRTLKIPAGSAPENKEYGAFFKNTYGFSDSDEGRPWRRIETDWLAAAESLALRYEDIKNNTSLVLAFELTGTNPSRFLLFVGDAQIGNWESWPQNGDGWTVTSDEIKGQTILYKVGHHGSTNASPPRCGLDKMKSGDLVAMIPVNQEWAKEKMGWSHPEKPVLDRLMAMCRGRVLRSDRIPDGAILPRPDEAAEGEWNVFSGNVTWDTGPDKLWIQYVIP